MLHPVSQPYQKRENTMTQRAVRKPKPSVGNQLRPSFPQRHWLELAEYASLAASGVGSLAVALSGHAFYGGAPVSPKGPGGSWQSTPLGGPLVWVPWRWLCRVKLFTGWLP